MNESSAIPSLPSTALAAIGRSAVGGWIAGILFTLVDLAFASARMPMHLGIHDHAVMIFYGFLFLPLLGLLLGAGVGLLLRVVGRSTALPSLERGFFFVLRLLLAVYGVAYLLFRLRNPRGRPLVSLFLLVALLLAASLAARQVRRSGWRLSHKVRLGLFAAWVGAITVSFFLWRVRSMPLLAAGRPEKVILFIVIDTLRADALGIYGSPGTRTPNIDALGREGAVFLHAQAAASWTFPSHASMFTGLSMVQHGANATSVELSPMFPTITEVLRDHGYRCGGYVSGMWVNSLFGFSRGFDVFDEETALPWIYLAVPSFLRKLGMVSSFLDLPAERRAGETTRHALRFLDREGSLFLWIHLYDPHTDYDPPAEFRPTPAVEVRPPFDGKVAPLLAVNKGRLTPPGPMEISTLRRLYDGEVSYVDSEIGRILAEIKRRGLADRTSILLTSDHGEAFGEHGWFLHTSLHQEILHVPFILWAPGRIPAGLRLPDVVRGIDVAATLADLAGVDWKTAPDAGRSVLPRLRGTGELPREARSDHDEFSDTPGGLIVESSLLVWPWKVIVGLTDGQTRLYNLERDPGERRDVSGEEPLLVQQLVQALSAGNQPVGPARSRTLDDETIRRLRSLGYLK